MTAGVLIERTRVLFPPERTRKLHQDLEQYLAATAGGRPPEFVAIAGTRHAAERYARIHGLSRWTHVGHPQDADRLRGRHGGRLVLVDGHRRLPVHLFLDAHLRGLDTEYGDDE